MAKIKKTTEDILPTLHIFTALQKYVKKTKARLHMPGHKGRYLPILQDSFLDCTELSYTDCLECPTDCILEAERDIANIFHAQKSFLLTDGATCGIFVMINVVKELGGKLVIARNSHKSVYNACSILGVEPIILDTIVQDGIIQQPTIENIQNLLYTNKDITALLLTTPDYYGNLLDLQTIYKLCKAKNILLFVDNAHGAFLHFDALYHNYYAGVYADVWVDSMHKTTPTLTQGALLHTNNLDITTHLLHGLDIFRTTSPSYLIMASVEYAAKYMQQFATDKINKVRQLLEWAKVELEKLQLTTYANSRTLVLSIDFLKAGYSVDSVQEYLEEQGIFAELNDGRYLLFYCSSETEEQEILLLIHTIQHAMYTCSFKKTKEQITQEVEKLQTIQVYSFVQACRQEIKYISLESAIHKVVGRNVGRTPPCFPLLVAGEKITLESMQQLKQAKHTFGMQNQLIPVLVKKS